MNRLKLLHPATNSRQNCVQSIAPFFRYLQKNWVNVLSSLEQDFPCRNKFKPVDHHPYRTNPRAQKIVDKCFESMEPDGDHPCVLLQKPTDFHVFVRIAGILSVSSLSEKHDYCPISSLIMIQLVARNFSQFATFRALTDKCQ